MPEDRGNCAILAFMAQVRDLPHEVRAINIRAWMLLYLLANEKELMVTTFNIVLQHLTCNVFHILMHVHVTKQDIYIFRNTLVTC